MILIKVAFGFVSSLLTAPVISILHFLLRNSKNITTQEITNNINIKTKSISKSTGFKDNKFYEPLSKFFKVVGIGLGCTIVLVCICIIHYTNDFTESFDKGTAVFSMVVSSLLISFFFVEPLLVRDVYFIILFITIFCF